MLKKTIFSGMQASGSPTLGNYLGTLKTWRNLQYEYNCIYCVVNMHSLTVRLNPATLKVDTLNLFMLYLASGLNPEENIIYYQSHVSAHAELAWVLGCYTYMGELNRMTQFKEKSLKHSENINAGLFTYPVLMASDILLYKADLVPVGEDQKQHLELTREIAERFNGIYGEVFKIPEVFVPPIGAKIKGLQSPDKKMSKTSSNVNDTIFLTDPPDVIVKKLKRAVTDSDMEVRFDAVNKPGISNLLTIYASITGKSIEESEKEFYNKDYGYFKAEVAGVIVDELSPIQEEFKRLSNNKEYIQTILDKNSEKASYLANKTMAKVYKKLGLYYKS